MSFEADALMLKRPNISLGNRIVIGVGLVLMAVGTALQLAARAHADENSYLDDLRARGIPFLIPAQAVSDGYRVCRDLREGQSPQLVAQTFGLYYNLVGPQIVDIAQHDLCPDTLH
ncbi:hypothetical protein A5677_00475 [Mycobacterium malmoense]|uniref:DUF732 domain-containing protein n=1 Tax=Mycobacterium malmoense TaxID=1780 RepID=A0A1B9CI80_MYCMA|nr:DUF732 domain-containing protein [Mycobacterium malmoense]OCB41882.1 hypothetical protein A5677_00475 [Mycobacterium malmoense]